MKKNVLFFIVLLISGLSAKAQYTTSKMELGKYADGTPAMATYISLNNGLDHIDFGQLNPIIMITDKQHNKYVLSTADFHLLGKFNTEDNIHLANESYFKNTSNRTNIYNFQGKKTHSLPVSTVFFNDSLDVLIGYKNFLRAYKGELSAYRISDGSLIWKQLLPHKYHWPWFDINKDKLHTNIYYMITDSLVRLDVTNGQTIKRPFTAGVDESMKSRFSLVKNRPLYRNAWKEAYMSDTPYIGGAVLSGTHSNFIFSGDSIFIADAKNLYCFDKQLNEFWRTALPADAGSKSFIELSGNKILLINFGIAFQKGLLGHCGKPFVARYDRHTGKQLFLTMPDIKTKLSDGLSVQGKTYWLDDKGLMYNNDGETEVHRIKWKAPVKVSKDPQDSYECYYWPVDTAYQCSNGSLLPIITNAHQVVVEANQQDVYILKEDGSQQIIKAENAFFRLTDNLYENNADGQKTYYLTDGHTLKVQLTFKFKGTLLEDYQNILYAILPNGVGVIKPRR